MPLERLAIDLDRRIVGPQHPLPHRRQLIIAADEQGFQFRTTNNSYRCFVSPRLCQAGCAHFLLLSPDYAFLLPLQNDTSSRGAASIVSPRPDAPERAP